MAVTKTDPQKYFSGTQSQRAREEFSGMEVRIKKWAKQDRLDEGTQHKLYLVAKFVCSYAKKGAEDLCRQDATKWVDQLLKQVKK